MVLGKARQDPNQPFVSRLASQILCVHECTSGNRRTYLGACMRSNRELQLLRRFTDVPYARSWPKISEESPDMFARSASRGDKEHDDGEV